MSVRPSVQKLELMFMKHYAPNRCLYIKVAKLRTGVGSADLQNCSFKIYLKRALEGGGGRVCLGGIRMDVNEELKLLLIKLKKKESFFLGGLGRGGGVGLGRRGGGGVRVDVNREVKFL